MTSWSTLIIVGALALGLARPRAGFHRYAIGFAIVAAMVIFAGVRQHTL